MEKLHHNGRKVPVPGDFSATTNATTIDRRQQKRVVPMRVIAVGLSRTGTTSLRQALIDLGYDDCYHFTTPLQENPLDQRMWIEAIEGKYEGKTSFTKREWDQLLGHCQSVSDTPCIMFWKELMETYPEAKIILTVRDNADQWTHSITRTILPLYIDIFGHRGTFLGWIIGLLAPVDPLVYRFNEVVLKHSPMMKCLWYDWQNSKETAKDFYDGYSREIRSAVPAHKLLVFNVKQGWGPLCRFLQEPEPNVPFPNLNDSATHIRNSKEIREMIRTTVNRKIMSLVGCSTIALITAVLAKHYLPA